MLNDFTGSGVSQLYLFDERPPRPHNAELMKFLDGINHSGLGQVWFSGRGIAFAWQMKREMISPAYTTRRKVNPHCEDQLNFAFQNESVVLGAAERQGEAREWVKKHQATKRT